MDIRVDDHKARSEQRDVPLCVDLDGTLLKTDTLWESLVALIMRNPLLVFAAVLWVLRGKAALKNEVAARTDRDPASWPYRAEIVDLLTREKQNGRRIVLATGAPKKVAGRRRKAAWPVRRSPPYHARYQPHGEPEETRPCRGCNSRMANPSH